MNLPPRRGRPLIVAVVTFLFLCFPALMAGAGIDAPVRPAEVAHLRSAIEDPEGTDEGGPAVLFFGVLLPAAASTASDERLAEYVPLCRLASVAGIFVISGILFLTVLLARGSGRAALSCFWFGLLPAVAREGALLRPEVPCAVFGSLGVLVLCGLPERIRRGRREPKWRAWSTIVVLTAVAGSTLGLAVASLRAYGFYLLVPGACMLLVVGINGLTTLQVLKRFRFLVLPFRAYSLRILPWLLASIFAIVATTALLTVAAPDPEPTTTAIGWLPDGLLAWPVLALAAFGGILWAIQVGLEIGRRRRISASVILWIAAVILLIHRVRLESTVDGLPAVTALALLLGEGTRALLVLLGGFLARAR